MGNKKICISIIMSLIFVVALIWLIFRACAAGPLGGEKVYHIGRDSTWYPLDLRGKERNMVGFTNDMILTIAKDQGFRPHVFEVGPNALFDGLDIETYDAVLSSLTPNSINRNRYTFSDPFYLVGPVLIVRIDSKDQSLENMEGKIIGIESGGLQVLNIPDSPVVVMIPYDTASEALENLDNNVIDAVILDALRAHVFTEGYYAGKLKVVSSPMTEKGLRLISRKDPQSILLISRFNEGLKKIVEDGVFEKLIRKWNLIYTEVDSEELMEEEK